MQIWSGFFCIFFSAFLFLFYAFNGIVFGAVISKPFYTLFLLSKQMPIWWQILFSLSIKRVEDNSCLLALTMDNLHDLIVYGVDFVFLFDSLRPINNLSVIKGRVFLG